MTSSLLRHHPSPATPPLIPLLLASAALLHAMTSHVALTSALMTSSSCPSPCQCRADRAGRPVVVDCRRRSLLRMIPFIPSTTTELDVSGNPIVNVSRSSFQVALPALRRLSMDNCLVERIERMTFRNLELLEILELSRNRIRVIDDGAFYGLPRLHELNLADNRIVELPGFVFRSLTLAVLDLSANQIAYIREEAFEAASVKELNLDDNRLEKLDGGSFGGLAGSLTRLTINRNARLLEVSSNTFTSLNLTSLELVTSQISDVMFLAQLSARTVDLSGNALGYARFPGTSPLSESCREMRLASAKLMDFSSNLAQILRRVQRLDLSDNSISLMESDRVRSMPDLRSLDLSRNLLLTRLLPDFSVGLGALEALNVSRCGLTSLPGSPFSGAAKLRSVDLSYNALQTISEVALMKILEGGGASVNLSGNPWHCNCEVAWLHRWLGRGQRGDVGGVNCATPPLPGQSVPAAMQGRSQADFTCSPPRILHITASLNLDRGMDVMLRCSSRSDPAADIVWRAPLGGDIIRVAPLDRTAAETHASWQVWPSRSGWYSCTAANLQGPAAVAWTYIHVVTALSPPADLRRLSYPDVPGPAAATSPLTWRRDDGRNAVYESATTVYRSLGGGTGGRGGEPGGHGRDFGGGGMRNFSYVTGSPKYVGSHESDVMDGFDYDVTDQEYDVSKGYVSRAAASDSSSGDVITGQAANGVRSSATNQRLPGGRRYGPTPPRGGERGAMAPASSSTGREEGLTGNHVVLIGVVGAVVFVAALAVTGFVACVRRRRKYHEGNYPVREREEGGLALPCVVAGGRRPLRTEEMPLHESPRHVYGEG